MTPWQLADKSEHSQQRALFCWANCAALYGYNVAWKPEGYSFKERTGLEPLAVSPPRPELAFMFAIHNQGHGDKIRGGRARAEGVKAGAPDIFLPVPRVHFAGLFIELKTEDRRPKRGGAGGLRPEQQKFRDFLQGQRYCHAVAYGWEEAASIIEGYL